MIPNQHSFNILFNALNINHRSNICDKYLNQMINKFDIKPDIITATILLKGCSSSGDVERAQKIVSNIINKYQLIPDKLPYITLISIYGQNGDLFPIITQ